MRRLACLVSIAACCLVVAACGFNSANNDEKIKIVDWQKVLAAHPKYELLVEAEEDWHRAEKMRADQVAAGKKQLALLDKLVALKQQTRANFAIADYATKMAEHKARQQEEFVAWQQQFLSQKNKLLAAEHAAIIEKHQLPIVNLRLKLANVRLSDVEKATLDSELAAALQAQNDELAALESSKEHLLTAAVSQQKQVLAEETASYSRQLQTDLALAQTTYVRLDQADLAKAPREFSKVLIGLDKQVQLKHATFVMVQNELDKDVQSALEEVTAPQGNVIVVKNAIVNINAEDLTEQVKRALQNKKTN
ncbi:MAG TPA: hypothetical protein IAB06_01755 [Candidatus Avacidaminococcus intestinavium]|uniref:Outer membrane protein (OmpH-like) n=1 Tax=Candidatus Avacidaminococcus intestinavium TaxID=2840684 RepID=A0A9D1MP81_9FIRM|nr:hypothetical protein [Candidatus Avacidaminococcus intestinavium]